ncbi:MAG: carbohydrate ABC transporter permease [Ardenticatenaceae bacterium]|nr:carbohydrate ABC transporter permease [Ardenticatenaceae bacterium]
MKKKVAPRRIFFLLTLGVLLLIEIYPIFWLLMSSIKGPDEFSLRPMYALPETFHWQNYVQAWTAGKMSIYFRNSVLATLPAIILTMLLGVMAAFAIEILTWRFKSGVLFLFLAGIMVPAQIVLLPLFTIYYKLHLTNNLIGLILVYTVFGMPLTVFLMTSYLKAIPREIFEAAIMDGASIFQVFYLITVPMLANAIVTLALVQFFFVWNDLLLSLTFISDTNLRTVQTGLLSFVGQFGQREWGPTFASISLTVIPTLLIYLFLNNKVIKGLTAGAVKG